MRRQLFGVVLAVGAAGLSLVYAADTTKTGEWPYYSADNRVDQVLAARSDQQGHRFEAAGGVAASAGRSGAACRQSRSPTVEPVHRDADHGERRAVCAGWPRPGRSDRSGNRPDVVDAEAAAAGRRRPAGRRRALGRRLLEPGSRSAEARIFTTRAQYLFALDPKNGEPRRRLRRRRQGGPQRRPRPADAVVPLERRAPRRARRRRHRVVDARAGFGPDEGRSARRRPRLRRPDRQAALDLPRDSARRRARRRRRGRTIPTPIPAPATSGR